MWHTAVLSRMELGDDFPKLHEYTGDPPPVAKEQTGDEMDAKMSMFAAAFAHLGEAEEKAQAGPVGEG